MLLDDDALPAPDWLARTDEAFDNARVVAVGGINRRVVASVPERHRSPVVGPRGSVPTHLPGPGGTAAYVGTAGSHDLGQSWASPLAVVRGLLRSLAGKHAGWRAGAQARTDRSGPAWEMVTGSDLRQSGCR